MRGAEVKRRYIHPETRKSRRRNAAALALLCLFAAALVSCGPLSGRAVRMQRRGRRQLTADLRKARRAGRPEWVGGVPLPVAITGDYRKMRSEVDRRFGRNESREAVRILYELMDNGRDHPKSWAEYYIAEALMWAKELPFAVLEYENRRNEPNALIHLASCTLAYSQFSRARAELSRALSRAGASDTPEGLIRARVRWMIAETYRKQERFAKARKSYLEAADAFTAESRSGEHADWYRSGQERSAEGMREMAELCRRKGRPPNRMKDGTYEGTAAGYVGQIRVRLSVERRRFSRIEVVEHSESIPLDVMTTLPRRMIEERMISVDGVSGATYSSRGVIGAVYDALREQY